MAAAPIVSLTVVAPALGSHLSRRVSAPPPEAEAEAEAAAAPPGEPEFTLSQGTGFAVAVLAIMLAEQTFLNAGPLLVRATEGERGAAVAGFAFNVLLLARAPLVLFQAVQTSILPHLTRLWVGAGGAPDDGEADPFRRSVNLTLAAIAAFAGSVALAMLVAGPWLMDLVFGGDFEYERGGLVLVSLAMGLYLSAATINQALLAQGRARQAATCWVGSAAGFVALLFVSPIDDPVLSVEVGLLGRRRGPVRAPVHAVPSRLSHGRVRGDPRPLQRSPRERQRRLHVRCRGVAARRRRGAGCRCARRRRSGSPLSVTRGEGRVELHDGGTLVAEGEGSELLLGVPDAVHPDDAEAASRAGREQWTAEHPFPTCVVCGPDRDPGDGYRIFPGPLAGEHGLFAAEWTPDASLADDDGPRAPGVPVGRARLPHERTRRELRRGPPDGSCPAHGAARVRRPRGRAPRAGLVAARGGRAQAPGRAAPCSTRRAACCAPPARSGSSCASRPPA